MKKNGDTAPPVIGADVRFLLDKARRLLGRLAPEREIRQPRQVFDVGFWQIPDGGGNGRVESAKYLRPSLLEFGPQFLLRLAVRDLRQIELERARVKVGIRDYVADRGNEHGAFHDEGRRLTILILGSSLHRAAGADSTTTIGQPLY
jgi:hypothetical protein